MSFTVNVGTYPVPTLNFINPNAILATTPGMVLNASGSNFASTAVLNFNGVPEVTTVNGPSGLSAVIPASQIGAANAGTVQVTVSNPTPGGGTSNSLPFQIMPANPIPSITSISPSSVVISFTTPAPIVTITGTNFQQGATLSFTGPSNFFLPPTFVSSTQLTFMTAATFSNTGTYTLYVIDPSPGGYSNGAAFTVTPQPDFSITSSGTTSQTVSAGQTATFTNAITASPLNGFNTQVTLTCAPPASLTTCNVNPNTLASGSGTATVTVTTTKNGLIPPSAPTGRFYLRPQLVPLLMLALLLVLLMQSMARTQRQRLASTLPFAILLLFFVLQAIGCGGGNPTPSPPPPGTPTGTYTVTVTGTASTSNGTLTHTVTLTLTVN